MAQAVYRIPLLGRLVRAAAIAVRLPNLVDDLHARLARLEQNASDKSAQATTAAPSFAAFYAAFEDRFRGSRDDIKERQRRYLPQVAAVVGQVGGPVIDIGCGRGEWLELLRDNGIAAQGIDANPLTGDICRQAGFAVVTGDAIDWLNGHPSASAAVISAFHLIEHLPFPVLLAILDQASRVLKPGGLLLLETPNPRNLQVGATSFWTDATHLRPLPCETTAFMVERSGFSEIEILPLHPLAEGAIHYDDPLLDRLNQLVHGAQDYAVLARKEG